MNYLAPEDRVPGPLRDALRNNNVDTIHLGLSQPTSASQEMLNACLDLAMLSASLQTIELLFQNGAKLNPISHRDAFVRGEPAVFQLLLNSGWDINSTAFELSAVHFALKNETLLTWLLEQGADPNTMSRRLPGSCSRRSTPLASAAKLSDPKPMEILFAYGAVMDPEAIFFAIGFGRQFNGTATLSVLIDHNADVNYVSKNWYTPLFHAVWRNRKESLKVLLEHGADPTIRGPNGIASPLETAKERGLMELYSLMERAISNSTS